MFGELPAILSSSDAGGGPPADGSCHAHSTFLDTAARTIPPNGRPSPSVSRTHTPRRTLCSFATSRHERPSDRHAARAAPGRRAPRTRDHLLRIRARTRLVAITWHAHPQSFVRSFEVIDLAPGIEPLLAISQISKRSSLKQLHVQCLVEPSVAAFRSGETSPPTPRAPSLRARHRRPPDQ